MADNEEAAVADMVGLVVDDTVCIGIGRCEMLEPDVFFVNDDAIAQVSSDVRLARSRANEIVMECPSGAISIQKTTSDEQGN